MIGRLRLVIALFCVVAATLLFVPLQLLAMRIGWPDENLFRSLWHKLNVKVLGIRVHLRGEPTEKRPLLMAANHISWTDIEVLGSMFDVVFIAKSDMIAWPLIGWLARMQRTIFVDRNARRKSGEQASEIGERLAAARPVVLFAEGSTGDGNFPLPFKSTLFGAAAKAIAGGAADKVYVQPVAIAYTRLHGIPMGRQHRPVAAWIGDQDLVPHLNLLLGEGGLDVEVHFGEPIEFSAGSNRKAVARRVESDVRQMMLAALADPRPSA